MFPACASFLACYRLRGTIRTLLCSCLLLMTRRPVTIRSDTHMVLCCLAGVLRENRTRRVADLPNYVISPTTHRYYIWWRCFSRLAYDFYIQFAQLNYSLLIWINDISLLLFQSIFNRYTIRTRITTNRVQISNQVYVRFSEFRFISIQIRLNYLNE